ncbi:hypothetical protein [Croceicoccus sp. YJ47]|uniref:glycoside hydrolase family 113 n=1 Tax=Croceicoccus sp. YJ47 TaxID=2798724 RepID=UPI0019222442|nr:hypothetical protein [Croceicoccus sp. YJ47]QQN74230.1 hypothetical protein JD971_16215 [Croceicoccus sp. YJ47]
MRVGVNLVEDAAAPFGSAAALGSFRQLAEAGASVVALIPFFWQPGENDPQLVPGSALSPDGLRRGIAQARECGLDVVVKPHVWVPERWAGAISFAREEDWTAWFAAYEDALRLHAAAAAQAGASTLCIGTELRHTTRRPEWRGIIERLRDVFPGRLTYVAHNAAGAEAVAFWDRLDLIAMTSYPVLGPGSDRAAWRGAMRAELSVLRALGERHAKPAWLGEIGLRSVGGATLRPWESAEERAGTPNLAVQRDVLSIWLDEARAFGIDTALIWRWLSDPDGGGQADTDFTIQNKPAARLLRHGR